MANLGSFAGGLADGIVAGSNLRMKKQQLDNDKAYNDKMLSFKQNEDTRASQRQGWEARDQDRKTAMQADMDAHFQKFADVYGSPAQPDASAAPAAGGSAGAPVAPTANLGGGAAPTVPTQPVASVTPSSVGAPPAPAPKTGNLGAASTATTTSTTPPATTPDNAMVQARRLAAASDAAAIHMKYSGDPTEVLKMTDYLKKNADDDHLRLMRKALNGSDPDAFSSIIKEYGGDPTKANVDVSKGTIDLGNGKPPVDLGLFLRIGGADVLANDIDANKKSKQGDQKFAVDLEHVKAETRNQGAMADYHESMASTQGVYRQTARQAALDAKTQAEVDRMINSAFPSGAIDYSDPNGKAPWTAPKQFVMQYASSVDDPKLARKAASSAIGLFGQVKAASDDQIDSLLRADKAAKSTANIDRLEARYNTTDINLIRQKVTEENLRRNLPGSSSAAPAPATGTKTPQPTIKTAAPPPAPPVVPATPQLSPRSQIAANAAAGASLQKRIGADPDVIALRQQANSSSGRTQIAANAQLNKLLADRYGQ